MFIIEIHSNILCTYDTLIAFIVQLQTKSIIRLYKAYNT